MLEDLIKLESKIDEKNKYRIDFLKKYYNINEEELEKFYKITCIEKHYKELEIIDTIFSKITQNNYFGFKTLNSSKAATKTFIIFIILKNLLELSINSNENTHHLLTEYDLVNKCNDDVTNFIIWYENKIQVSIKHIDFSWIFRELIIYYHKINILNMRMIWQNGKTYRCYEYDNAFDKEPTLYVSLCKFEIYKKDEWNIFGLNYHFSMTFNIFKNNSRSNAVFKTQHESKLIENLTSNWVYLDKIFLKNNINTILEYNRIEEKKIESNYKLLKKELSYFISSNNKELINSLSKKISLYNYILKLKKILDSDLNNKIFLSFKFDFRGRLYYLSELSPTHDKIMRYCLNWGKYENIISKDHIFNDIINNEIDKWIIKIDDIKKFKFLKKNNKIINRSVVWIIISIAEIRKTKIGDVVKIENFIDEGVKMINGLEKVEKLDDILKFNYYMDILKEIENDIYIKRFISKDATASCYQHLIKCLGPKEENSIKWCNLKSKDTWFDTYGFIIKDLKKLIFKEEEIEKSTFDKIFNRGSLKRIIMTLNYGAGERICWKYFKEECEESLFENNKEYIHLNFKKIYKRLTTDDAILLKTTDEIIKFIDLDKNRIIKFEDDSFVNFNYFKIEKKQTERKILGDRFTTQSQIITNIHDNKKRKISARANYVQSIDACLVRWFLIQQRGITIHDCFMIDYLNTTFLISKINEGMRETFHDLGVYKIDTNNMFSLFIIL